MAFFPQVPYRQVIPGVGYQIPDMRMSWGAYQYISKQIPLVGADVRDALDQYRFYLDWARRNFGTIPPADPLDALQYLETVNRLRDRWEALKYKYDSLQERAEELADNVRAAAMAAELREGLPVEVPNQIYDAYLRKIQ